MPGAAFQSAGVATVATATSVEPYWLYSTSPKAAVAQFPSSGDSADPATNTMRKVEVS